MKERPVVGGEQRRQDVTRRLSLECLTMELRVSVLLGSCQSVCVIDVKKQSESGPGRKGLIDYQPLMQITEMRSSCVTGDAVRKILH